MDTKHLFSTHSTQGSSIYKTILGDVCVPHYDFKAYIVSKLTCISGSKNLADTDTKADSPSIKALQELIADGRIPISFDDGFHCSNDRSLGYI